MGMGLIEENSHHSVSERELLYSDLSRNLDLVETSPIPKKKRIDGALRESSLPAVDIIIDDDYMEEDDEIYEYLSPKQDKKELQKPSHSEEDYFEDQEAQHEKKSHLRKDLLHVSILDVYMQLKTLIREHVDNGQNKGKGKGAAKEDTEKISEEESKRLLRLGNLVLVDYVRAMVELLA